MGRPIKQTVDYFPHYVRSDSKTKSILEQSWGNDGYAFWFKLLELLGRSEGHFFDCSIEVNARYLYSLMKIDASVSNEILDTLALLGNIDRELWEKRRIIWCQSFVDNLQVVYAKRSSSFPQKPTIEADAAAETKPERAKEQTATEEKPKAKKQEKPEVKKVRYAEFVHMTEAEYEKLTDKYGEKMVARMIEVLDNYKGQCGKTYKSDYRAMLNWVVERVQEEYAKNGGGNHGGFNVNTGYSNRPTANPDEFRPSTGFRQG